MSQIGDGFRIATFVAKLWPKSMPSRLQGRWDYSCIMEEGADFPFQHGGGNAHGGFCDIRVVPKLLTTELVISGHRTWQGTMTEEKNTKESLAQPMLWDSVKGAFISNKEVMYQYSIRNEPVYGITFLNLDYKKEEERLIATGNFYYFPEPMAVPKGSQQVLNNMIRAEFGKVYGKIELTNRRKL